MRSSWTGEALRPVAADDGDLAVAIRSGDMSAFEQLVDLHEESMFRYAQRLLDDASDAQEVVQDAFLRAHRALTSQYDEERCRAIVLRPWLLRIVRNLSYNKRRDRGPSVETPLPPIDENGFQPLSQIPLAPSELERKEEAAALDRALRVLPTESRDLLTLRFFEEMSYAEIAQTTGLNESSLRGRVFRSLRLLRDVLAGQEVSLEV